MSLEGKSLYVLTPMYGGNLTLNYHNSFVQLCALCKELNIELSWSNTWNESLISRARNRLADSFLKESSCTHSCFIDADIGFDARDIITMLGMDKDILGVPCTKKSIRWDRIQFAIARRVLEWIKTNPSQNGNNSDSLAHLYIKSPSAIDLQVLPQIGGDFVLNVPTDWDGNINLGEALPMKHVGTGLLMVKREVFLKFMKAYPNRWYQARSDPGSNPGRIHDFFKVGVNPETREYDSEDYWFIHDCIELGYQALLCPWVKTTHMGTNTFIGDMPTALASAGSIF